MRTPIQWDGSLFAGFSDVEPWLPLATDHTEVNVQAAMADPHSMLTLYRRLLSLRRSHPGLATGAYVPVAAEGDLLLYRREGEAERLLVALNLGGRAASGGGAGDRGKLLLSTFCDREAEPVLGEISLRGNEGVVVRLS